MKLYNLSHLTWLIPVLLGVLLTHQVVVYYGIGQTFRNGEAHTANITDFRIKQIAAQTNGYVDLQFFDEAGNDVRERLSLHAQHAARLIGANEVEIRYLPGTTHDIVITQTFDYHRNTVLINISVILLSLMVMIPVSVFASRYALRKKQQHSGGENDDLQLEYLNRPA